MAFTGGSIPLDKIFEEGEVRINNLINSLPTLETTVSKPLSNTGASGSRTINEEPYSVVPQPSGDLYSSSTLKFSLVRLDEKVVWDFICPPASVKWGKLGEVSTVAAYGTNTPVVVYSSTSMRQLSLSEVIVEGFTFNTQILSKIKDLERMMDMASFTTEGFVSPYVWNLRAGQTSYGLYIIASLDVEETLRNNKGESMRAIVTIQLQEIGAFQVNTGRDLAAPGDLAIADAALETDADAGAAAGDGKNGGAKEDPPVGKLSVVPFTGGLIVSRDSIEATCDTVGKTCTSSSALANSQFEKMNIAPGQILKDGIAYQPLK